jgi:23S rRNA (guanosine2251-2'-O)-methyltransferase
MTANLAKSLPSDPAVKPEIMSPQELDSLLPEGSVHQGLAVQAEPLSPPALDQVLTDETNRTAPPLIFLDQVSDPHNVGAILRSAAAFGAAALIVQDRHAPPITGTLAKTASGAVEHVPIIRVTNLSRALEVAERSGYFRIGLAGEAIETLSSYSIPNKVALVLGAEGPGLRRLTREKCDVLLRLPTQEPISSLNVSNAAAVALFALTAKA